MVASTSVKQRKGTEKAKAAAGATRKDSTAGAGFPQATMGKANFCVQREQLIGASLIKV